MADGNNRQPHQNDHHEDSGDDLDMGVFAERVEEHEECLFEIDEADVRLLIDIYRDSEQNPYAANLLINGLRIQDIMKGYPMKFLSPLRLHKDSGTFISTVEYETCVEVGVFTLTPQFPETFNDVVFTGLNYTKKINYDSYRKNLVFKNVHDGIVPVIKRVLRRKHLEIEKEEKCHVFKLDRGEASALQTSIPFNANIELKSLNPDHSIIINDSWPFDIYGDDVIRTQLDVNGGYGVFRKSEEIFASWGLKTMMGQVDYVQTLEEFQRKGYASIVVKNFAREFAGEQLHTTAVVPEGDTAGYNFFENIGFKKVGECANLVCKLRRDSYLDEEGSRSNRA